jgi:hypothetical protein
MPKIERTVHLPYQGQNYIYTVCAHSDARAVLDATHKLEEELGKMRGSLKKEINAVLDNVIVQLK